MQLFTAHPSVHGASHEFTDPRSTADSPSINIENATVFYKMICLEIMFEGEKVRESIKVFGNNIA